LGRRTRPRMLARRGWASVRIPVGCESRSATFVREMHRPQQRAERGRFAPSPSGPAHPGTLLAGLLAWLDARSRGAGFALRLEDVDTERCTPEHAREMREALRWLGLDWDAESVQTEHRAAHEAALDALAAAGWLYPCRCSRAELRRGGRPALDG